MRKMARPSVGQFYLLAHPVFQRENKSSCCSLGSWREANNSSSSWEEKYLGSFGGKRRVPIVPGKLWWEEKGSFSNWN